MLAHVYGDLIIHDDVDWLRIAVSNLTDSFEAGRAKPWKLDDAPEDYVIATGTTISLESFVSTAFAQANLDWKDYVTQDPALFRPTDLLIGRADSSKALERMGWKATTQGIEVVKKMYQSLK